MSLISVLAITLLIAFLAGRGCARIGVPRVTGYVIAGFLVGPSVLNVLSHAYQEHLAFVGEIALALILFNIGGEFDRQMLRRIHADLLAFGLALAVLVTLTVSTIVWIWCWGVMKLNFVSAIAVASILGLTALAAAPPTTVLVIREYDAEGPLTRTILLFLLLGTLTAIAGARLAIGAFEGVGVLGEKNGAELLGWVVLRVGWSFAGAVLVGALLGLLISYWEQYEPHEGELILGVLCSILVGLLFAEWLGLEPMLVSLTIGAVLVNASNHGKEIHHAVKSAVQSIYALFFVLAGAHIQINGKSAATWGLAAVYVLARTAGFVLGAKGLRQRFRGCPEEVGYAGLGLLSHAGAAIGILLPLKTQGGDLEKVMVDAVFASIVVFEIAGPLSLKTALLKAGEVRIGSLITTRISAVKHSFKDLLWQLAINMGLTREARRISKLPSLAPLIRHKVMGISSKATLRQIIKFVSEHPYPIYPVVNENGVYEGLLDVGQIQDVSFDPILSQLILAMELIGSRQAVLATDGPQEAYEKIVQSGLPALPVIDAATRKYLGIVLLRDLIAATYDHPPPLPPEKVPNVPDSQSADQHK